MNTSIIASCTTSRPPPVMVVDLIRKRNPLTSSRIPTVSRAISLGSEISEPMRLDREAMANGRPASRLPKSRLWLTISLRESCSRCQPICPANSNITPMATQKISAFCHAVSSSSRSKKTQASAPWATAIVTYQRFHPEWRTSNAAARLVAASIASSHTAEERPAASAASLLRAINADLHRLLAMNDAAVGPLVELTAGEIRGPLQVCPSGAGATEWAPLGADGKVALAQRAGHRLGRGEHG